jgi:hypothetical protein
MAMFIRIGLIVLPNAMNEFLEVVFLYRTENQGVLTIPGLYISTNTTISIILEQTTRKPCWLGLMAVLVFGFGSVCLNHTFYPCKISSSSYYYHDYSYWCEHLLRSFARR